MSTKIIGQYMPLSKGYCDLFEHQTNYR